MAGDVSDDGRHDADGADGDEEAEVAVEETFLVSENRQMSFAFFYSNKIIGQFDLIVRSPFLGTSLTQIKNSTRAQRA